MRQKEWGGKEAPGMIGWNSCWDSGEKWGVQKDWRAQRELAVKVGG